MEINDNNKNISNISEKNVFKILKISSFGIYFNSSENNMISMLPSSNDIIEQMDKLFSNENDKILNYDYIFAPSNI